MPISYKNKIYTTLGTPTGLSGNVVSATDSAGVPAKDYTIKGKTIVWNQLVQNGNFVDKTGWFVSNGTGSVSNNNYTFTVTGTNTHSFIAQYIDKSFFIANHKYYATATIVPQYNTRQIAASVHNGNEQLTFFREPASSGKTNFVSTTFIISSTFASNAMDKTRFIFYCPRTESAQGNVTTISNVWMTDLTKMFGAGNEPSTPEEFRAMFPDDYYPYNAGELKSIMPTSVEASGVERFQLLDKSKFAATITRNGVTFTNNGDGTITVNGTCELSAGYVSLCLYGCPKPTEGDKVGHKYGVFGCPSGGSASTYRISTSARNSDSGYSFGFSDAGEGSISTNAITEGQYVLCEISIFAGYTANNLVFKPQLFDLTQMFGAGNEPATPAEFWQRVPEKLYGYNPNDYKSANIPSSKYFPDGMKSAGSAYDEINFLSQKAIKRIGSVDLGTLNWTYDGAGDNRYFKTIGISDIKKISNSFEMPGLLNAIYPVFHQGNWYLNKPCMFKIQGDTPAFCIGDPAYTDAAAFKAAMSGVMLYYELDTPVETAITPPLQTLHTFNGFTSFSAPNSLTQNGPLSVTYYAEGGANPEKGWLTSYKRKLYMGRSVEWNQLFTNSEKSSNGVTISQNQDGTMTLNGTANKTYINFTNLSDAMNQVHKYLLCLKILNNPNNVSFAYGWLNRNTMRTDIISNGENCTIHNQTEPMTQGGKSTGLAEFAAGTVFNNVKIAVMVMDLTQMFGAGNEPATSEEFWSYFDHNLYPYNPGETQPLFKISRKSRWGGRHYTARWDKVNAKMVRLNDAASFPTDTSNFGNFGSVNPDYDNPLDNIYPWSGIRLCNIDLDAYMALQPGDSITKCVKAWEGDPDFNWSDGNGIWRYRPEFWGSSWDDGTYRYFDVTDKPAGGYVHYPESIGGRWHGRAVSKTINGVPTTCLLPTTGIPAVRTPLSTLHTYAKNYGATLDSIYSIDADTLLLIVEYATMNSQRVIGNGVTDMYRQGGYQIAAAATDSTVVKVLASDGTDYCIPGAIFDIGTSDGGNQVGSYYVVSAEADSDPTYLDVTLNTAVTVTRDNYWSVHGLINQADASIGSKSGYIGTNSKCNAYYRGMVLYGNMWFYTLGAYENAADKHIWIAADAEQADAYDALDTSVHIDTGLVLPTSSGYIQTLGLPPRSGLLALPPFCTAVGGNSENPVGDYFYNDDRTYNTVLLRGGYASTGPAAGALYGVWNYAASTTSWISSARPCLKNP